MKMLIDLGVIHMTEYESEMMAVTDAGHSASVLNSLRTFADENPKGMNDYIKTLYPAPKPDPNFAHHSIGERLW